MKTNNTASAENRPGLGREFGALLKNNVRDYVMYIALVAIFLFFGIMTKGRFLSPRNLSDLINQTGYVAVLAIGMTLILIIKHIDLSVGYVAGFLGAVSALMLSNNIPVYVVIPVILLCGAVVGLYQGTLVSIVKVPAFVTTLAGMFIFRGLLSMVTAGTGTIIVRDETFKALSNGFLPDFMPAEDGIHKLTVLIGLIAAVLMVASQLNNRRQLLRYQFKVNSLPIFIGQLILFSAIIVAFILVLANYKGLPWTAVIVAAVLFIYNFVLNKTRFGRSVYGIGGNSEAAELSGINVRKVTLLVFASMSMLAALSGMLYTSRLASATPQAGLGFELDAIASSYIGGVSVGGGIGKVTNTIIGALVIMSLTNGMNLMGVDISVQYVVKGVIFIIAVAFDVITRGKR
ncbi:MAG TPA: sugar ABC transporter permease [Feifaniaceae bacterium]|nr:sugar ABC transporter permease [Feifaniaceae bacterium]